jgi:hypothetical protein
LDPRESVLPDQRTPERRTGRAEPGAGRLAWPVRGPKVMLG